MSTQHTTWTTRPRSALRVSAATVPLGDEDTPASVRLLTIREIASACQLSEKAVRRAINDGELTAIKLRSRLRVTPWDFAAWIAAQRQQRTSSSVPSSSQRLSRGAPAGTFRALAQANAESWAVQ